MSRTSTKAKAIASSVATLAALIASPFVGPGTAVAATRPLAGMKVGIAMREEVNGFDMNIVSGVQQAVAAAGGTTVVTNAGGSVPQQVTQIKTLIDSGVKGIVIGLGTASVLAPLVKEAEAKGIVVTSAAIGGPIPGELADVSGNEFMVGAIGAQMLLQYIHYKGDVYAYWVPGAPVLDARLAALTGMAKNYPAVHIHTIPTTFSPAKVYSQVKALLAAHSSPGSIGAVWVAYDQLSTGAVQAVEAANSKVPVFSEDGGRTGFKALIDPKSPFMGTVADDSGWMGRTAGQYLVQGIEHKTAGIEPETFGPAFAVTRNNLVAAAQYQFGAKAWSILGTSSAAVKKLYPQNEKLYVVYPTLVQHR